MKEGSAMCEELDKIINAKLDAREERGRNEGRSEGEIDSKRRTARNLTKMGMSIEQIAEAVEEDISVIKEYCITKISPLQAYICRLSMLDQYKTDKISQLYVFAERQKE